MSQHRNLLVCSILAVAMLIVCAGLTAAQEKKGMKMEMPKDRAMVMSKYNFEETLSNIKRAIEGKEMMVLFTPDHQEMLKMVGVQAKPMTTVEFFHPRYGKLIFMNDMAAAIEVPIRIIVMDGDMGTMITYRKPSEIFKNYKGLADMGKALDGDLSDIVGSVAMPMPMEGKKGR